MKRSGYARLENMRNLYRCSLAACLCSTTQHENMRNLYWCSLASATAAKALNYHLALIAA